MHITALPTDENSALPQNLRIGSIIEFKSTLCHTHKSFATRLAQVQVQSTSDLQLPIHMLIPCQKREGSLWLYNN